MALTLGDNFSYGGSKPLDARLKYATLADMKAVVDATMYDGCLAYCVATDKTYQWKSTNTVDINTGKWREFTPVITATATADATSSATPTVNVTKTGTDAAPNFAFAFSGLKGAKGDTGATGPQGPSGAVLKNYSTSEQDSGLTWVDGKKLYQKTINCGTLPNNSTKDVSLGFTVGTLAGLYGFCYSSTGTTFPVPCSLNSDDNITVWLLSGKQSLRIKTQTDRSAYTCWVTILYTK